MWFEELYLCVKKVKKKIAECIFGLGQMELDRSADPPAAIWVSTTKSTVNKWVSTAAFYDDVNEDATCPSCS